MDNVFSDHTVKQEVTSGHSLISFTLEQVSEVSVEIYDLHGNQRALIPGREMGMGEQQIPIHLTSLGIAPGKYVYYLQIVGPEKTIRDCRTMQLQ